MGWKLVRICPEDECPGTCCKKTGIFPTSFGDGTQDRLCQHFDENLDPEGRKYGGCPFFDAATREAVLTAEEITAWEGCCRDWPVPLEVPAFDTEYSVQFGAGFGTGCACFEWQEVV